MTDPEPSSADNVPGTGACILVVDDDSQIRQLVSKLLRDSGYQTRTARDGRETRDVIASGGIDLVILDLMLPGTNGLDLCKGIRKTSSLPIIMLSARGSETDRVVGLEIGADDYISKPFGARELLARVNAVLRRAGSTTTADGPSGSTMLMFEGWTPTTAIAACGNWAGQTTSEKPEVWKTTATSRCRARLRLTMTTDRYCTIAPLKPSS